MTVKGNLIIGVTGGISAYKSVQVCSNLKKKGYQIKVVMTASATRFVAPLTFEAISENPVTTKLFPEDKPNFQTEHISHARWGDLFLICPATANIIGKYAAGIADDFLSTMLLAVEGEVVFVPAMNSSMYKNTAVQENMQKLKRCGCKFLEPASGFLACGEEGIGKLPSPEEICKEVEKYFSSKNVDGSNLKGKQVIVTAGATREKIDAVRYITNPSSGKMGFSIAKAFRDKGAEVTLICASTTVEPPDGMDKIIKVTDTEEMYEKVMENLDVCDIIIKAAAVSDFKPKDFNPLKMKKEGKDKMILEMTSTPDILSEVGKKKKNQILIGFAAETDDLIENAEKKLRKKNLDMIVANDISAVDAGFEKDVNTVKLIFKNGKIEDLPTMEKDEVGRELARAVEKIME